MEELGHSTGGRSPVFTLWQNNHLSALQLNRREADGALMQSTGACSFRWCPGGAQAGSFTNNAQPERKEAACLPASQNEKSNSYSTVSILMLLPQSFLVTQLQPNVPPKFSSILHASLRNSHHPYRGVGMLGRPALETLGRQGLLRCLCYDGH